MQDIISKLNTLKSIKPEKNWVVETRKKVLSETPVLDWKVTEVRNKQESEVADRFFSRKQINRDDDLSRLCNCDDVETPIYRVSAISTNYDKRDNSVSLRKILFSKKLAVSAFAFILLISGSILTVEASKSSLPGDSLYAVKIASEDVTLAIAPKDKKAELEIEQAGKRLEELVAVSKKSSDDDQSGKTEQLLASFEKKINSAQSNLTEIENNGVKAKIAKVINTRTEEYTEVLAETSENIPDVVKNEVLLEKLASAVESNEKVNFDSLAMRVEVMTKEDEEEIIAIVKKKAEEKTIEDEENTEGTGDTDAEEAFYESDDAGQDATEEEKADDTECNVEESEETEVTMEDTKKELLGILDGLNSPDENEGDVKSDNCVCEIDAECGCVDASNEGEKLSEESENEDDGDGEAEGVFDEGESEESAENSGKDSTCE